MLTGKPEFAKLYYDKYSQLDVEGIVQRLGTIGVSCVTLEVSNDQCNGYESYLQVPYFKYDGYVYSDFEIDGVIESLISEGTLIDRELL